MSTNQRTATNPARNFRGKEMKTLSDVKKGDQVFVVGAYNNRQFYGTVKSAGEKWITLENGSRYHRESGRMENYSSNKIFASREEWEALEHHFQLVNKIARVDIRSVLNGFSDEKLLQIAEILGISLEVSDKAEIEVREN